MVSFHHRNHSFGFSREEIVEAVKNNKLLSMEIEFSLRCNFHCPYCYVPQDSSFENELTKKEIQDVILQAKKMGAKKIIILGGEPMLYPHILEIIEFMKKQDLAIEMFSNGSLITADLAKYLFTHKVNIVLKMNTFNERIQDMLAGKKGAFKMIQEAFTNLKEAGYPSEESFLAVSTIICSQNIDELTNMWLWLRDRDIIPYFEMITPQGNAKQNEWLTIDPQKAYTVFKEIANIDLKRYGRVWDPQPPLVGDKCMRHQFSCLVTSQGYVMPCVGVTIEVGNIRKRKLSDIINNSEVFRDLKNFHHTIKGPCRTCEKSNDCYGCRGAAYQLTGDYLASDPLCWKNADRQKEIAHLPFTVEKIIPQKSPMKIIDSLVSVAEGRADVALTVDENTPFIGEDGTIDEAMYLEMMAQAIAAQNGFKQIDLSESAPEGFLLGAKNLQILGKARVGDTLKVSVHKYAQYGGFAIVKGTVLRGTTILAQGEIKVWHN